jgi:hypothetical protein
MKWLRPGRTVKWLKRFTWAAAWGTWLWMGTWLYRELPRGLGPLVGEPRLLTGDIVIGFLGEERKVVAQGPLHQGTVFRVYDVATGMFSPLTEDQRRRYRGRWNGMGPAYRWWSERERNRSVISEEWFESRGLLGAWNTVAIKDGDTDRVIAREWLKGFREYDVQSEDERFVVNNEGVVRRTPGANWPLLVLCQVILAGPLVLLNDLWRRRRRASRVEVAP